MGKGKTYSSVENVHLFRAYASVMDRIDWAETKPSGIWEAITTSFHDQMEKSLLNGEIHSNPGKDRTSRGLRGQWRKLRQCATEYVSIHDRITKTSPPGTSTELNAKMAILEYQELSGKSNAEFLDCFREICMHPKRSVMLKEEPACGDTRGSPELCDSAGSQVSIHDASTVLHSIRDSASTNCSKTYNRSVAEAGYSDSAATECETGLALASLSQSETWENSGSGVNMSTPRLVKKSSEAKRGKIRKREHSLAAVADSLEMILETKRLKLDFLKEQHKRYMAMQERQRQVQLFSSEDMPIELRKKYMTIMGNKILHEIEEERKRHLTSVNNL